MKLKKIASLMLAGIMAVSMLAGCKSGNPSSDPETPVTPTGLAANVMNELSKNVTDKVSFTVDGELQKTVENFVVSKRSDVSALKTAFTAANLHAFNPDVSDNVILANAFNTDAAAKKTESMTGAWYLDKTYVNLSDVYVAKQLASKIESVSVYDTNKAIKDLPDYSATFSNEYRYDFEYTGEIAVVEVEDAVTGDITYFAAFSITLTPTKVEY